MSVHDLEEARAKRALLDLNLGTDDDVVITEHLADQIKRELLEEADSRGNEDGSNQ